MQGERKLAGDAGHGHEDDPAQLNKMAGDVTTLQTYFNTTLCEHMSNIGYMCFKVTNL